MGACAARPMVTTESRKSRELPWTVTRNAVGLTPWWPIMDMCSSPGRGWPRRPYVRRRSASAEGRAQLGQLGLAAVEGGQDPRSVRSEEHTSELPSLMRISYAVFCLKTKTLNSPPIDNILH